MHQRADKQSTLYADLVYYFLGATARAALEKLMQSGKYQYRSDFAREYFAKGRAEGEARGRVAGRAEGLLLALEMAHSPVPERLRAHIQACDDPATLDRWYSRIRAASALSDIFAPDLLKRE